MELLTRHTEDYIQQNIIKNLLEKNYKEACHKTEKTIKQLHNAIPPNKRISYGIVHTVKLLGEYLYVKLEQNEMDVYKTALSMFNQSGGFESKTVALCILSFHGLKEPVITFPLFKEAAASQDWQVREISQMLFRKLILKYPEKAHQFLLEVVISTDPNIRRFVSETIRPVCENKWFYKQPDFSLSILKYLFTEKVPYPRTSVGNNLSDLARYLPELVYGIIENLVKSGDKNSYWIAYRACRNLVKKEPDRVMKLLNIDSYKYKNRIHTIIKTHD